MLYAIVAVIALILDQIIKYWTTVNIVENTGEAKLIPGFIHLTNVHNYGAAFSFLQGGRWFFVVLCLLFVAVVIYLMLKETIRAPGARWAAIIVMAGAVGNAIDRVIEGFVVDMFEFDFLIFGHAFPVFNLADMYITIGAIVFCIFMLTEKPAPAGAERRPAEKETARTSARRRQKKTEIPAFPKREPRPAPPPMDPNDPFAEWERKASEPAPEQKAEAPTAPRRVTYTQPAAAEQAQMRLFSDEPEEQPAPVKPERVQEQPAPAEDVPAEAEEHLSNTERVMRMLVQGTPPAAPEEAAKAPTPEKKASEPEYDLDEILAEFKDL